MTTIEDLFAAARSTPSDINEHLDLLRDYAARCNHITEFGLRWGNGSTVAFLAAQPQTLISWDIDPLAVVSQSTANLLAVRGRTNFQPRTGDSLKVEIEPTDFLFIDSLHTFKQLFAELERHGDPRPHDNPKLAKVRKYIGFHDTETFGMRGEDGKEPGLLLAIRKFQREVAFPLWKCIEHRKNNNGLILLERIDVE